jgi:hypothetical protein
MSTVLIINTRTRTRVYHHPDCRVVTREHPQGPWLTTTKTIATTILGKRGCHHCCRDQ